MSLTPRNLGALLIAMSLALGAGSATANVAKFRVVDNEMQPDGKTAKVTIAWEYQANGNGYTGKGVQFFVHSKPPQYANGNRGAPVSQTVDMTNGQGVATLTIDLPAGAVPGGSLCLTGHWPSSGHKWGMGASRPGGKFMLKAKGVGININRATAADLAMLPGIGPGLAKKIVARRDQQGLYRSANELTAIKGISANSLGPVMSMLMTTDPKVPIKAPQRTTGPLVVNINTASVSELTAIPGIGPSKAQAIFDHRNATKRNFASAQELTQVSGIKQGLVNRIAKHLTTQGTTQRGTPNSRLRLHRRYGASRMIRFKGRAWLGARKGSLPRRSYR